MCAPPCDLVRLKPKATPRRQYQAENMSQRSRPPLPPFKVVAVASPPSYTDTPPPKRSRPPPPIRLRFEVRDWWNVPCRDGDVCRKGNRCLFRHDTSNETDTVVAEFHTQGEAGTYAEWHNDLAAWPFGDGIAT